MRSSVCSIGDCTFNWYRQPGRYRGTLLLTLDGISDRIALGEVADLTGKTQFPLTQPCGDTSCFGALFPPVTQNATDLVPILDLGSFAAGETKSFDASVTFDFEDDREGVLQFLPLLNTVVETTDVPEPESAIALVAIGLVATRLKRKAKG
ncbi:MAG: hypothetical protein AAGJ69_05155 [Cyanobacteria bacterium J06559_1]